jgi:hypothetical protein
VSSEPSSDASIAIARKALSILRRRCRTAAISVAEMRAPSRLASLRSISAKERGGEAPPTSRRYASREPRTMESGSSTATPSRRTTAGIESVGTDAA